MASRRRPTRGWMFVLAAALSVAMVAAACGGDDDDTDASGPDSTATPAGVTGKLTPQSEFGKRINSAVVPEGSADGKKIGSPSAKVVVEAYEDFGCPHCLEFTANIEPTIFKEYVATGKVLFEYKYFPLRQHTAAAAIAAQCAAEQDRFWEYHRSLFIAQAEANEKVGPALSEAFAVANLKKIAVDLELDTAAFDACLAGDSALNVVQAELKQANDLVLPGTPSFVINGKVTPAPDNVADWRKLLDGLLK